MKLTVALLMAVLVTSVVAVPAQATHGATFELTLYGDVPEGDAFGVGYEWIPGGGSTPPGHTFCGRDSGVVCRGNGTVYRWVFTTSSWRTQIHFAFARDPARPRPGEVFFEDIIDLEDNPVIKAHYTFSSEDDAEQEGDDQQVPDQLPETGVGGTTRGVPVTLIGALAQMMAAGCLARGQLVVP